MDLGFYFISYEISCFGGIHYFYILSDFENVAHFQCTFVFLVESVPYFYASLAEIVVISYNYNWTNYKLISPNSITMISHRIYRVQYLQRNVVLPLSGINICTHPNIGNLPFCTTVDWLCYPLWHRKPTVTSQIETTRTSLRLSSLK